MNTATQTTVSTPSGLTTDEIRRFVRSSGHFLNTVGSFDYPGGALETADRDTLLAFIDGDDGRADKVCQHHRSALEMEEVRADHPVHKLPRSEFTMADGGKWNRSEGFEWAKLPLPLRAVTVDPCVAHIEVGIYTGHPGEAVRCKLSAAKWVQMMFRPGVAGTAMLQWDNIVLHLKDGGTTYVKWWSDGTTGAFTLTGIGNAPGRQYVTQGGYAGHVPAGIYRSKHKGGWRSKDTRGTGISRV